MAIPERKTGSFPPAVVWVIAISLARSIVQQFAIRDEVFVSGD